MGEEQTQEAAQGQITPEEMGAAIESSGYLIEARISRILAHRGFFVEPNVFRTDPNDPNKAIETDVAGRYLEIINEENRSSVTAAVLLECKNNSQPLAFFVQPQQVTEINDTRINCGGFPAFSLDQESRDQVPMRKLLQMKDWHHYCRAKEVATQFCTFERSGKKWKAGPNKNYSDSFSKIAVMAVLDIGGGYSEPLQNIQFQLSYPVVVFQGPIFSVREDQGKARLEEASHLQLHHFATNAGELVPVQIDLVTEAALPALLETILEEMRTCRDRIMAMYARLLNSALDQRRVAAQRYRPR